jgi:transcriptional regulator with XRE-family HTH domain
MRLPDASKHNPDPAYLRDLVKHSGLSQRECARRIGIGERLFRMYLAEEGVKNRQPCTYAVQFCLEALALNNVPACELCGYHSLKDDWLDEAPTCPKCRLVQ